jgi:hypothetical protein
LFSAVIGAFDAIPFGNSPTRKQCRMTAATVAGLIIREEYMATAAIEVAALSDDELRQRVLSYIAEITIDDAEDGADRASERPDPATMSRDDMIELLVSNAGGWPPTFAISEDEDDPLVDAARELRREGWERDVAAIKLMGLTDLAADRHRAAAEQAELAYLRRLIEEALELPDADLRLRAREIVAKQAGGTEDDKQFPHDPDTLSRGYLLAATADHIEWLTWSPELRSQTCLAAE